MGNLEIPTTENNGLKIEIKGSAAKNVVKKEHSKNSDYLKNYLFYIISNKTKDIQVYKAGNNTAEYALEQKGLVKDIKSTPDNKFLLVTNYNSTALDVISLADDMKIKQLDLASDGGEILIDKTRNKAYISAPNESLLYVLDIQTMTLTQKIKLKGNCTNLTLTDNDRKILYVDKKTNEIWTVELDNDYATKYIGSFPNVSKLAYTNGKIYITSRVASRIAVVDYETLNLMMEVPVNEKPIDLIVYKNNLYILSASTNTIQILDTFRDEFVGEIKLNTQGFSTKICNIDNIAIVTDALTNQYSIVNLNTNKLIQNNPIDLPVSKIIIVPEIRKN